MNKQRFNIINILKFNYFFILLMLCYIYLIIKKNKIKISNIYNIFITNQQYEIKNKVLKFKLNIIISSIIIIIFHLKKNIINKSLNDKLSIEFIKYFIFSNFSIIFKLLFHKKIN
jgi:hypothetical protein